MRTRRARSCVHQDAMPWRACCLGDVTMGASALTTQRRWILSLSTAAVLVVPSTLSAQTNGAQDTDHSATTTSEGSSSNDWLNSWIKRVDDARASQPHYVAPIVTTHVVLVEQYRYDVSRQRDANGVATTNFGGSRGLELIPTPRLEIGISPPPYMTHQ